MVYARKVVKVFLASPGDLKDERLAAKSAVDEFNAIWSDHTSYYVELVGWEETVSSFGRPQATINQELEKCELFIGIIWKRWGTPPDTTGTYTSGFEEEFELSVASREHHGKPEISLYFKDVPSDLLADQGEELKKVQAFKTKIQTEKKILYETFAGASEFQSRVHKCVSRYIQRLLSEEKRDDQQEAAKRPSKVLPDKEMEGSAGIFSPESAGFIRKLLTKTYSEEGKNAATAYDVARLRLLSCNFSMSGNDEQSLGTHDANLLFVKRSELKLGGPDILGLYKAGCSQFQSETIPVWYWYAKLDADDPNEKFYCTLWGGKRDRLGGLEILRLAKVPLSLTDHISKEVILADWFASNESNEIKTAALRYLADMGEYDDLIIVRQEYEKNNTQTASAAVDAIVRISNRKSKEAAVSALLELQPESVAPDLVNEIFLGSELPSDALAKCSVHRSPAVRRAAIRLLRRSGAITNEAVTILLTDSDYEVRREVVHHLVDGGRKFSDEELRDILVKKKSGVAGVTTPDESSLNEFWDAEYKRMGIADLQKLSHKDSFYDRPIQFALAEQQFQTTGPKLRASVENFFEVEYDNYVAELERSSNFSDSLKTTIRSLKDYTTKNLTRKALDIVSRRQDRSDLSLLRKLMGKAVLNYSSADTAFMGKWGSWEDIPLLVDSLNRLSGDFGLLSAFDFKPYQEVADTILRIGSKDIRHLLLMELPNELFARLVQAIPNREFGTLGDEFLRSLLLNKVDSIRKSVALKCVLSLTKPRIKKLLDFYIGDNGWRYYNAVFWLDAGASLDRKFAKMIAVEAVARAWPR
jgi:hypothetical protein